MAKLYVTLRVSSKLNYTLLLTGSLKLNTLTCMVISDLPKRLKLIIFYPNTYYSLSLSCYLQFLFKQL